MLSKTDFLLFLEAPMHLWAAKHDQLDALSVSQHDLHLREQGIEIELVARDFLQNHFLPAWAGLELSVETTVTDRHFKARLDALVYDSAAQVYDLYEIKSATSVKKEHLVDVAFQRLIAETNFPVRHTYLVHVNKDYTRTGPLEISEMFQVVKVDEKVADVLAETRVAREAAWAVVTRETPDGIEDCLKPNGCPCSHLCHPGLPNYPIYDLPRLNQTKARQLKSDGVVSIQDIPEDFQLTGNQRAHAEVVWSGQPRINRKAIREALARLEYPLYFLDYETFAPAIPEYDGYRPYQHLVFQYSLHVFQHPDAQPDHHEFLAPHPGDPAKPLLEHLLPRIGTHGSVIVWNKPFEATRNREMAERYPEYADRLIQINARIFDLMEIFKQGLYTHPDFHGSASIKNVLPVLVPDLSYDGLSIPKGDDAMMAWVEITKGHLSPEEIETTRQAMLEYCALDTLAMVRIWQVLEQSLQ